MKKPKVSIVIPIYNDEKYLEECLDSVVKQTFNDFECICVDDCSTDGTAKIIERFRKIDKRIKCIKHDKNMGVSSSRYTGLLQAKADWIAFVDHDDVLSKKYLEYLYNAIGNDNEIKASCCMKLDLSNNYKFDEEQIKRKTVYSNVEEIKDKDFNHVYCIWAKLLRKEELLNLELKKYENVYPRAWFEDVYVTSFYFIECKKIVFIDNVLYGYRVNHNSLSRTLTDIEYFVNRPECDYVLANKYFQMNMFEKGIEIYQGMLLAYIKAVYTLKNKTNNKEARNRLISEYNRVFDENSSLNKRINIFTKLNTIIFRFSPLLWEKTIGFLYFDVAKKWPWLYAKLGSLR